LKRRRATALRGKTKRAYVLSSVEERSGLGIDLGSCVPVGELEDVEMGNGEDGLVVDLDSSSVGKTWGN